MLSRRFVMVLAIALVAGVAATPVVLAGSIGIEDTTGPGLGSVTVDNLVTGDPNNNDYTGEGSSNPNQLAMTKDFHALDYVDTNILVADTGGATEYWVTETVTNHTGAVWADFHFYLGYFTGESFVGSNGDELDFDEPDGGVGETGGGVPNPTSDQFASHSWVVLPDALNFYDGTVGPGETVTFGFSIDVPDWNPAEMPDGAERPEGGGYRFTLREVPTIPEASTYLLFSLGALGLLAWRRRSKAD
jgi:hypothetical protein